MFNPIFNYGGGIAQWLRSHSAATGPGFDYQRFQNFYLQNFDVAELIDRNWIAYTVDSAGYKG